MPSWGAGRNLRDAHMRRRPPLFGRREGSGDHFWDTALNGTNLEEPAAPLVYSDLFPGCLAGVGRL